MESELEYSENIEWMKVHSGIASFPRWKHLNSTRILPANPMKERRAKCYRLSPPKSKFEESEKKQGNYILKCLTIPKYPGVIILDCAREMLHISEKFYKIRPVIRIYEVYPRFGEEGNWKELGPKTEVSVQYLSEIWGVPITQYIKGNKENYRLIYQLLLQAIERMYELEMEGYFHLNIKPSNILIKEGILGSPIIKFSDHRGSKKWIEVLLNQIYMIKANSGVHISKIPFEEVLLYVPNELLFNTHPHITCNKIDVFCLGLSFASLLFLNYSYSTLQRLFLKRLMGMSHAELVEYVLPSNNKVILGEETDSTGNSIIREKIQYVIYLMLGNSRPTFKALYSTMRNLENISLEELVYGHEKSRNSDIVSSIPRNSNFFSEESLSNVVPNQSILPYELIWEGNINNINNVNNIMGENISESGIELGGHCGDEDIYINEGGRRRYLQLNLERTILYEILIPRYWPSEEEPRGLSIHSYEMHMKSGGKAVGKRKSIICGYNNRIYIGGGERENIYMNHFYSVELKYPTELTNEGNNLVYVSEHQSLSQPKVDFVLLVTHNNKYDEILCMGGRDVDECSLDKCEIYHSEEDEWRQFPSLHCPRAGHAGVCLGGVVYVFGGVRSSGENVCSIEYIPLALGGGSWLFYILFKYTPPYNIFSMFISPYITLLPIHGLHNQDQGILILSGGGDFIPIPHFGFLTLHNNNTNNTYSNSRLHSQLLISTKYVANGDSYLPLINPQLPTLFNINNTFILATATPSTDNIGALTLHIATYNKLQFDWFHIHIPNTTLSPHDYGVYIFK